MSAAQIKAIRMITTSVYVDGFNLYYRALKSYPQYRWLNLAKLSQAILPGHQINRIRYFTALVDQRPNSPEQQYRQLIYLRALRTIPNLSIHYGQFKTRSQWRPLARPVRDGYNGMVLVRSTEEKGTDVNLATYLVMDGYDGEYEQALVISNDSDLALPIGMVRDRLKRPVGVVNPNPKAKRNYTPVELREAATFLRRIRLNALRNSQFPDTLADDNGTFTKPPAWS